MIKERWNKNAFSVFLKRAFLVSLLLLLTTFKALTQNLYFSNLTVEDGLPSGISNSIVEDVFGFVWIGTQEGLCRYDGNKMTVFKNKTSVASIPSNNISTLLAEDSIIWVGTWNGLCTIDVKSYKITRINIGGSKAIRALYKDNSGRIWVGTSNGLIVYDKTKNAYSFFDEANSGISHNTIRALHQSKNGDMWIGTYDKLNLFRNNKFESFDLKGDYKPWLKNNLICTIEPYSDDHDSLLWVGTETGLCLLNTATKSFEVYNSKNTLLSNEVVKCIYRQNDATLWLGTDFGLNLFNVKTKNTQTFYHDPLVNSTISNNVIWEIMEDSEGRLWFITSNGVSLLDNHRNLYSFHEEYHSLGFPKIGNQLRDILVGRDKKVWLASIYGVICHDLVNGTTEKYMANGNTKHQLLLNNVYALKEDLWGRIWIGTAGGINIWDNQLQRMHAVVADGSNGLSSNYINSFALGSDSSIWLSAWEGGLYKVIKGMHKPDEMRFVKIDDDGDGKVINAGGKIFYGSHKNLWEINEKTYEKQPVTELNKLLNEKEISSLLGNESGNVWVGAENLLLSYSSQTHEVKKTVINIGSSQKLISLQNDAVGNIWAASTNSVFKIDIENKQYYTVPISRNSPLKSFYASCSDKGGNGEIYFGGENGYIVINPSVALPNQSPSVYLTSLYINNQLITSQDTAQIIDKDIAFSKILHLKHDQNSILFEFSTLDYLFPEASQYAYRLMGEDSRWHYTSSGKNFAVFSNLSPGEYVFELKGTNHFGIWSKPVSLQIKLSPPLWLSTFFLFLYLVALVAISYFVVRVLKYRHKLNQELKLAKLEKQHAEELFQAKQQFFTNMSHEFRTPLSLILPPIQQMLKADVTNANNRKLLKLANRNALRLYKLVNQLLDFGKMESSKLTLKTSKIELVSFCKLVYSSFKDMARRHEIDYKFNSAISNLNAEVDVEKFETILFNLLSNAFKYTEYGGTIELRILPLNKIKEQAFMVIQLADTGIGIPKSEQKNIFERFYQTSESKALNLGSGIGLTLAQEYAKLHNGEITLESEQSKGSVFTVTIPINEQAIFYKDDIEGSRVASEVIVTGLKSELDVDAKHVLIIDDNEDILDYVEMNLNNQYRISRAVNGQEGLELALNSLPQLIISDIMMPLMDGLELCSKIKENPKTMHIPVILLTAKTLDAQKTEGMNTGANMYITKPFNIDYFKSCIESVFRREELFLAYIKNKLLLKPDYQNSTDKNRDEIFLKKVVSIIEQNISNPDFSVEMLGDEIGMSTTHLYRKLKLITKQSTSDIIKNYKMQKAAQMLKNNEGNISEVMYAVGFSSLSSFSKSFKAVFDIAPSKYGLDEVV